ncbi:hypothetical protein BDQ17DRAFT_1368348 [Cyathus striatus]|nr:hypothetical protein BDQ17DRAFT_1368348 [Cyathus striatus]
MWWNCERWIWGYHLYGPGRVGVAPSSISVNTHMLSCTHEQHRTCFTGCLLIRRAEICAYASLTLTQFVFTSSLQF